MSSSGERLVKALMTIRMYKPEIIRVGKVILKTYVLMEDKTKIEELDVKTRKPEVESLLAKLFSVKREILSEVKEEDVLVSIDVEGKGFALHMGDSSRGDSEKNILFPKPSKLIRVGVISDKGGVKWYKPPRDKEYYVYEGFIEIPENAIGVIIDTEAGSRVITRQMTGG